MSISTAQPSPMPIEIVPFDTLHLQGALALSQQVKWPHRLEDWRMVADLSQGVVALQGGRVVGTGFSTRYNEMIAANALIIVDQAMQGQGLGRRLMRALMDLTPESEIRLVATSEGEPLYRKLGFIPMHRVVQHQALVPESMSPTCAEVSWDEAPDLERMISMDAEAFGGTRRDLLVAVAKLGRVASLRRGGEMRGFTILRHFGRGEVVGPVVASDLEDAKALISFAAAERIGAFLRFDVPEASGLSEWLLECGFPRVGGGLAMSTRPAEAPATQSFKTFGLVSQALG